MTRNMVGPMLILAALASPAVPALEQATQPTHLRPGLSATARATVSIRIVSGVRFGSDQHSVAVGADRRKAELTDADGLVRSAELLEFQ